MKFMELVKRVKLVLPESDVYCPDSCGSVDPEISLFVSDSRKIVQGVMFACVKGERHDGHDFAKTAAESGAVALFCERRMEVSLPQIICSGGDIRRKMGLVAAALYDNPASKLTMIALTGTNGKTTSTFMTKSILEKTGAKVGLLGTVYNIDGVECEDAEHTTPEGSDLQTWLYKMVENGCCVCVMETSSHAIHQGRIDGVAFDRMGFTNLSVEHLDYHIDMENYFAAKSLLFEKYARGNWKAAVNIDDMYGRRLCEEYGGRAYSYGLESGDASFTAVVKGKSVAGMDVEMSFPDGSTAAFKLPLIGDYNVLNALQAAALAWSLDVPADKCAEGLTGMPQVPGRLERYTIAGGGTCIIDFAHSPDGLEKVLTALRPVCKGRLITAFGAGGDRDNSKRPLMGEIAARLSDIIIITSDNPRSEDPERIARQVEEGSKKHPTERIVIVDRQEAIFTGLDMLKPDDIFVIAGKGPERYQIIKDEEIPFLDKGKVMEWAALRGKEVL